MLHVNEVKRNMPSPSLEHAHGETGRTRPPAGAEAIERIAAAHGAPLEFVHWHFWNAWDALQLDAKFPDYLLVLTERRVLEALRLRGKQSRGDEGNVETRPGFTSIPTSQSAAQGSV